jgi:hypothetical protein
MKESWGHRIMMRSTLLSFLMLASLPGCTNVNNPDSPPAGDWNVTISVTGYDEFNRQRPTPGVTELTLVGKDRTLRATIPRGGTAHTFTHLPYQTYVASAQQAGYYPASLIFYHPQTYGQLTGTAALFAMPSALVRIDSITCSVNTIVPQVHLKLFTAQVLPFDGTRSVILFAGIRPDVSGRLGDYVYASLPVNQNPGTSYIQTDDLFRVLRAAGISSGMEVYVTGRIASGATIAGSDATTGISTYTNLENNTRAMAAFIMP